MGKINNSKQKTIFNWVKENIFDAILAGPVLLIAFILGSILEYRKKKEIKKDAKLSKKFYNYWK